MFKIQKCCCYAVFTVLLPNLHCIDRPTTISSTSTTEHAIVLYLLHATENIENFFVGPPKVFQYVGNRLLAYKAMTGQNEE